MSQRKKQFHGGIPCPRCGGRSQGRDSRILKMEDDTTIIVRRRRCELNDLHRFNTVELVGEPSAAADILSAKARKFVAAELRRLVAQYDARGS